MIGKVVALARSPKLGTRERKIISGIAGLLFAKGVSFATLLFTVPLILHHLGTERFGVWMTLTSLSAVLVVSDLGVGNGIKNEVARAFGRNDREMLRRAVLNGIATQLLLGLFFISMLLLTHNLVDWASLFNVKNAVAREETNRAALIFMLCSFLTIPLSVGIRIRAGMQREDLNGLWSSATSLVSLVVLVLGVYFDLGLPALLLCFAGTPVVMNAIATTTTFVRDRDLLAPSKADIDMREIARMFGQGLRYFAVTIVYIATFTIDNVVIARTLGPNEVALYSVADRLLQIISVVLTMVNAPFWPAYAAAHASGDNAWVLRTFKRAFTANLLFSCVGAAVLLALAGPIYHLWVGSLIVPALPLLLAIAGRRIAEALYSTCNVLLNSLDELVLQIGWGLVMAATAVVLRLVLVSQFGLNGVPLGVAVAVLTFGFIPAAIAVKRLRRATAAQA